MKKIKGFTLVELLAVIAILGLILIIAIPKVMDTINNSKKRTLELTAHSIIKSAEEKKLENDTFGISEKITCESVSNISKNDYESCNIEFNENGEATITIIGSGRYEDISICNVTKEEIVANNGKCEFTCKAGETLIENVSLITPYVIKDKTSCINYAAELATKINFSENELDMIEMFCNGQTIDGMSLEMIVTNFLNNGISTKKELVEKNVLEGSIEKKCKVVTGLNCTYDGDLVQGAEFIHNQYTYRYKQENDALNQGDNNGWKNITIDGWGVRVTDIFLETDPVNTPLCLYINGKPLVSTSWMFVVPDSDGILWRPATFIDVSTWDTDNVINMEGMFAGIEATSEIIGLDKLETSNVTNMKAMFFESAATSLDLSSFDTSNVTNMEAMFAGSAATSLNLSSFDTSMVTNMRHMFADSAATSLDLSSFNTSNVTDMSYMFEFSSATIGYARTQTDTDKFNNASVTEIPSTLRFTVKKN